MQADSGTTPVAKNPATSEAIGEVPALGAAETRRAIEAPNHAYFADVIVEHTVLLELKSIERILPVDEMQTLKYLRLSGCTIGVLMNFNSAMLKGGLRRFIP